MLVDHNAVSSWWEEGEAGVSGGLGGAAAMGSNFGWGWVEALAGGETPIRGRRKCGPSPSRAANGMWAMNASRIVYVVDEAGPMTRFGVRVWDASRSCGVGEERFLIEWDRATNRVWYEILAFSRPRHVLARLDTP